jgi:hypothetical protein
MLEIRGLVVGYDKPLIRPLDLRLGGGESAVFFWAKRSGEDHVGQDRGLSA